MHEHAYELKTSLFQTNTKLSKLKFLELWEQYSIFGSILIFISVVIFIILRRTRVLLYFFVWIYGKVTYFGATEHREDVPHYYESSSEVKNYPPEEAKYDVDGDL